VPRWPSSIRPDGLLDRVFGADVRALAIFRVALGVVVLGDLASRAADLTAHYTDAGVWPRDAVIAGYVQGHYSPAFLGGSTGWATFVFVLAAASAIALIAGFRTRIVTVTTWILMVSIQTRNIGITQSVDTLIDALLLWGAFAPLGARWSVDARRSDPGPTRVLSVGTAALVIQPVVLYLFAGIHKLSRAQWLHDGTAIHFAVTDLHYARPFASFVTHFPQLASLMTLSVVIVEIGGALLLVSPVKTQACRAIGLLSFLALQLGIGTSLSLGPFPFASTTAILPLLPAALLALFSAEKPGPIAVSSHLAGVPLVGLILIMIALNVRAVAPSIDLLPAPVTRIGQALRLDQWWGVYLFRSRDEAFEHGWVIIPGHHPDGTMVDLWTNKPLSYARPDSGPMHYRNIRWSRYFTNLRRHPDYADLSRAISVQHRADRPGPGHLHARESDARAEAHSGRARDAVRARVCRTVTEGHFRAAFSSASTARSIGGSAAISSARARAR